ncbi:MAG TPA: DUF4167 domain-containing protein [Roseiarcus sp.]|nr:DUF4167 domain-containing protein [Roseiarcus sp.]
MRPGQNKRMRGRNNNRRGPNPLSRSYESNGPDVKIRGNAQHVAEKYLQLARDAHTSGDPVGAENYLQHAEHYFRIIASAQAAQQQMQAGFGRPQVEGESEDLDDDDDVGGLSDRFASPAERQPFQGQPNLGNGPQPQPQPQGPPYQDRGPYDNDRPPQGDRPYQGGRQDRPNNRMDQRDNRGPRPDRPYQDRQDQRDNRGGRDNRGPRDFRPYRDQNAMREQGQPSGAPMSQALPPFISAPVRVAPPSENDEASASAPVERAESGPTETHESEQRFRGKRRRRPNFGYDNSAEGQGEEQNHADPSEAPAGE